ncbi:MAG: AAA family ATPase [Deltaproteobacteria bacterium]|nr:AAA family ATPase [Deltaproteobacteria bacterium]
MDDFATELMVMHPAQPELVVLIDLLGYRDLDHLKRFTSFACSSLAPDIALRVLIVQSAFVTVESASHLAEQIAQRSTYLQDTLERVVETLTLHRPPGALELLKGLLRLLPDPKAGYEDLLYNLLTALPSDVQSLETAQRLGLPTEGLHPLVPTSHTTAGAFAQPLWLKQVRLTNLRAWGSGEFNFSPPAYGQGQWVFLVGDNGTGKTTVLRAIALSLMQDGVAARVLSQTYGALVKNGAESGEASVTLNDDTTWQVRLQRDGQVERKNGVQDFVVGYGPRRGTILGVTERESNFAPGEELETLFVEGGSLIHAPAWLKRQHHRWMVQESQADKHLLPAVLNVLKRVLPGVDSIEVGPDEIRVKGGRVGDTTIEAMSDGYLTTAGWVVDLMARWLERERVAKRPIPNNFNQIMTGLVLLDEVDLHLHPRWQWSLIEEVRALFPKLSFIVSTHNPLTLLGSKEGRCSSSTGTMRVSWSLQQGRSLTGRPSSSCSQGNGLGCPPRWTERQEICSTSIGRRFVRIQKGPRLNDWRLSSAGD